MKLTRTLKDLRRRHWQGLERLLREAWEEGNAAGLSRAHGMGRRGRTIRGDATVAGLVALIERHFGLDRYGFEVRVVHGASGRRVPATDRLDKYRRED
jgi:hypothetical protein